MSRDLVTSLHPSHRRDAKVVFDDMTDTKTLPKVDPVPSASLEKKAVAAEPSEPTPAPSKQPRKKTTPAKKKNEEFLLNLTQGFPRTCLYWYYHLCLFGIYQS